MISSSPSALIFILLQHLVSATVLFPVGGQEQQPFYAPGNASWLGDFGSGDGTPNYEDFLPISYVIYGPESVAICRVILNPNSDCPTMVASADLDPTISVPEVKLRAVGDNTMPSAFPIKVCDAKLETSGQKAAWTQGKLKFSGIDTENVPITTDPKRWYLTADTGLRSEPKDLGLGKCDAGPTLYGLHQCPENFTQADLNETEVDGSFQGLDMWPLKTLMDKGAEMKPDVFVVAGDYLYRQGPCPEASGEDCVGINGPTRVTAADLNGTVANFLPGNWGDTFYGWWADAIYPMLSLLKTTPMIAARGNHEECSRSGHGFFVLLDPHDYPADTRAGDYCATYTSPYAVAFQNEQFLVIDGASIQPLEIDDPIPGECPGAPADGTTLVVPIANNRFDDASENATSVENQVSIYTSYWETVKELSQSHDTNFVVTHRPVFGAYCSEGQMYTLDWTMQVSLTNDTLDRVSAVICGHFHFLEAIEFEDAAQPVSLLLGNGGTIWCPDYTNQTVFPYIEFKVGKDEMIQGRVKRGMSEGNLHGFALMERNDAGDYDLTFVGYNVSTMEFGDIDFPLTVPKGPRVTSPPPAGQDTNSSTGTSSSASRFYVSFSAVILGALNVPWLL